MRVLTRCLLVVALLVQLGAHLVVAQSYAWTLMALDRWKSAPLPTALAQTFDGRHPCGVCIKIQKDSQSRKNAESRAPERSVDFSATTGPSFAVVFAPIWTLCSLPGSRIFVPSSIELPPPLLQA